MAERATTRLRRLLARPGLIAAPVAYDPLTARLAERVGFECLSLGGYALGAQLAVSEPLLSLKDVVDATRAVTAAVGLPLIVDAGAGFGEPLHVVRTVREFERAGAAAIHIEDQVYPKRAHYHKGIEHTVPAEEFVAKIRYACRARTDPDFVIVARTDAMRTESFAEGIRRANLAAEAGAELVMIFPNDAEEARQAPRLLKAPAIYVNSSGNRAGRPIFSLQELERMGYKVAYEAIAALNVAAKAVLDVYRTLRATGSTGLDEAVMVRVRQEIEAALGLDEYYRIEAETVEGAGH